MFTTADVRAYQEANGCTLKEALDAINKERKKAMPDNFMTDQPYVQPIIGYRDLSVGEVALINEGKALAEQVRAYAAKLQASNDIDHRWLNIGVTHVQQGFMAFTRAIAQPTTF